MTDFMKLSLRNRNSSWEVWFGVVVLLSRWKQQTLRVYTHHPGLERGSDNEKEKCEMCESLLGRNTGEL